MRYVRAHVYLGSLIKRTTAGAIWSNTMPDNLEKYLPWLTDEQRAELFGSITSAASYPLGDPVREGVISGTFKIAMLCTYQRKYSPIMFQRTTTR
jgi:hypothetical protein